MPDSTQLPRHFPVGTKYIVEARGPVVRRYVEFPDGRRVQLEWRKAQTCTCAMRQRKTRRRVDRPKANPLLLPAALVA